MADIEHGIECSTKALEKDEHMCLQEGCKSYSRLRQSIRINIIPNVEDKTIEYYQSLFRIYDEDDKDGKKGNETLLMKYWLRITYIILKGGNGGVYKDSNEQPIFGSLVNHKYNVVGDIKQYDIQPKNYGNQIIEARNTWSWGDILNEENSFPIELPYRKGIKERHLNWLRSLNDAFDNIRINLDNNAIKHYLVGGIENEDWEIKLKVTPSVNSAGWAAVTWEFLPKNPDNYKNMSNNEKIEQYKKLMTDFMSSNDETHLIQNKYQDTTDSAWNNWAQFWKLYCLMTSMRYSPEDKKADLTGREVENNYFSYELGENFILQTWKTFIKKWNKLFNENNQIEKTVNIQSRLYPAEILEGGTQNALLRQN